MCLTLRMSGRVRGTVGPPGLSLVLAVCWSPSCCHTLCCHCECTEWKCKGRCVCVCNHTIITILLSYGIGLDLFWTGRSSFVYFSKLPLSPRDLGYIIERKVRPVGFYEAVNFPQGTHTNSDSLGIKGCQEQTI